MLLLQFYTYRDVVLGNISVQDVNCLIILYYLYIILYYLQVYRLPHINSPPPATRLHVKCFTPSILYYKEIIISFYLNTLLSCIALKRKVLCSFIDFSKVFDTVWIDALWNNLLKGGINGKFWGVVMKMCNN